MLGREREREYEIYIRYGVREECDMFWEFLVN